jgi:large subunit ribosomal protein L19e
MGTGVRIQRKLAAKILRCGTYRVWLDPTRIEDIEEAITRGDIRSLIKDDAIKKKQKKGVSRSRVKKLRYQKKKGRRRGHGSRKGAQYARTPRKREWIQSIRSIRRTLKELREQEKITRNTYRKFYRWAKGGMFRSKSHLMSQIQPYLKR